MKSEQVSDNQVIISCSECGHEHHYESLEVLERAPLSTTCENCGFLFLQRTASKIDALITLLSSDPKAATLLKDGRFDEFEQYFRDKIEP